MRPGRHTLLLFLIGVLSCTSEQELPRGSREVAIARGIRTAALGCYRLDASTLTDTAHRQWVLAHLGTFRLRADSVMARPPDWRRVSGMPKVGRMIADTLIGVWVADSLTDSIRVTASDGFQGVSLVLAPANAEWHGRVVSFTDFGPQRVHHFGHIRARPMSCADTAAPNALSSRGDR